MSHVFHRMPAERLPTAVAGDGPYLIDSEGRRYLDASGGAAVSCLGHSHARVREAIQEQAGRLAFAHSAFFTNEPMERLADHLVDAAPGDLDRVYFVTGGSEAIEAALKLAHQYHQEAGEGHRRYFIARRQSYHGNTLGALAVGGNQWRRKQYSPILMDVEHIAPCYPYREQQPEESDEAYGERAAEALEERIAAVGADQVIAFVAETVVGATLGAVPPPPGYFKRVREICDRHGTLLILDEVMCGMGRTGTLFACEQDGVVPDIVAIAKGLGAGYQPIGAMLCRAPIYDRIVEGSGFFQHGHTYLGHATACAGALAVQQTIAEEDLLTNVRDKGALLRQRLEARFGNHPYVGDIRGRGLFLGVELVADRGSKAPLDPALKLHGKVKRQAMAAGLICYPNGGTIDGRLGTHILLAPPFIIDDDHVEEIVDKLDQALTGALSEAGL